MSRNVTIHLPGKFPCGCVAKRSRENAKSSRDLIIREDGIRICRCGRMWKIYFIETFPEDLDKPEGDA